MPAAADNPITPRRRVRVRGVVQGVGFRPFVYGLAERHGLCGWVLNDDEGVLAEVQGEEVDDFVRELWTEAPPLSRIDAVEVATLDPRPLEGAFRIEPSRRTQAVRTTVPVDAGVCRDCLEDLFDPGDRRYRYPFLSCTHCGPRWTITARLPYDRPQTSMAGFPLCPDCAREYREPSDRRFHAQPIACPACGPQLSCSIETMVNALMAGSIVALKGLGGFHLACDATQEAAVRELRVRKERGDKPFAVMVASVAAARRFARLSATEEALLQSPRRPIVLAELLPSSVADSVAPGLDVVGLMLPSTPLHYLLFHEAAGRPSGTAWLDEGPPFAFVMTSANPRGKPLVIADDEAERELAGIADLVVTHDRAVVVRTDDSVIREVAAGPILLRRARGWVPEAIALSRSRPPVLGLGAHLKATACVLRGAEAYFTQHVGDLDDVATTAFYREAVRHLLAVLEVEPTAVACDLHPDLFSRRFGEELGLPIVEVQHHHAHVAAVLAEHQREGRALGLVLDGYGMGDDGGAWGGELLLVEGSRSRRLGHLAELAMPGGDRAAREPWRMAVAALVAMGEPALVTARFGEDGAFVAKMIARGLHSPPTSSAGRWFDAVAGLSGLVLRQSYEAEAAMKLEALVRRPVAVPGGHRIREGVLDMLPLMRRLVGLDPRAASELWHGSFAAALVDWAVGAARAHGLHEVVLAGGCFANRVLGEAVVAGLAAEGLVALLPRRAPPGDGGLSLGQALVAAQRLEEGSCV
ncbi:MAG: carbamoyltransferase HypF [Myxococcales bacterium]|nr:carbamoyltransferase HypF [Myxococcales bacterium]